MRGAPAVGPAAVGPTSALPTVTGAHRPSASHRFAHRPSASHRFARPRYLLRGVSVPLLWSARPPPAWCPLAHGSCEPSPASLPIALKSTRPLPSGWAPPLRSAAVPSPTAHGIVLRGGRARTTTPTAASRPSRVRWTTIAPPSIPRPTSRIAPSLISRGCASISSRASRPPHPIHRRPHRRPPPRPSQRPPPPLPPPLPLRSLRRPRHHRRPAAPCARSPSAAASCVGSRGARRSSTATPRVRTGWRNAAAQSRRTRHRPR